MIRNCRQFLSGYPERWARDTDRRDRQALCIEDRHGDAAQTFLEFLVIDCVAATLGLFYLRTQSFRGADGARGKALESGAFNDIRNALLRQECQNCLSNRSAMDRVASPLRG